MTAEPTPVRPPSALARLGRLAAIVVVLLAAWYAARLYVNLARGPAPAEVPPPARDDAAAALAAIPAGPWSMGDQPWDLRSTQLAAKDVPAWLDRPPAPADRRPANPLEAALLTLLRARAKPRPGGAGLIIYAHDAPALRVRGIARREGGTERLLEARAAFPERGAWRALEVRPGAGEARPDTGPGLLPWPNGADRLAVRRDEGGAKVAEMMRVGGPLAKLVSGWRAVGWAVTGEETLTCRGPGGEVVQLWAPSAGAAETVVLAIRSNTPTRKGQP